MSLTRAQPREESIQPGNWHKGQDQDEYDSTRNITPAQAANDILVQVLEVSSERNSICTWLRNLCPRLTYDKYARPFLARFLEKKMSSICSLSDIYIDRNEHKIRNTYE